MNSLSKKVGGSSTNRSVTSSVTGPTVRLIRGSPTSSSSSSSAEGSLFSPSMSAGTSAAVTSAAGKPTGLPSGVSGVSGMSAVCGVSGSTVDLTQTRMTRLQMEAAAALEASKKKKTSSFSMADDSVSTRSFGVLDIMKMNPIQILNLSDTEILNILPKLDVRPASSRDENLRLIFGWKDRVSTSLKRTRSEAVSSDPVQDDHLPRFPRPTQPTSFPSGPAPSQTHQTSAVVPVPRNQVCLSNLVLSFSFFLSFLSSS